MTLLSRSKPAFDETLTYRCWTPFCCGADAEHVVRAGDALRGTHPAVKQAPQLFVPGDTLDEHMPHPLSDQGPSGQIRQVHVDGEAA